MLSHDAGSALRLIEMVLHVALDTVVGQGRIAALDVQELVQLGVRENLTLILRILKIVFLDVVADELCHVDTRLQPNP